MKVIKYQLHASFYGKGSKDKYSPCISWKLWFSQANKQDPNNHINNYKIKTVVHWEENNRSSKSLCCEKLPIQEGFSELIFKV